MTSSKTRSAPSLRAPLAQVGQHAVDRGDEAHVRRDRFDEHRGDLTAVTGEHLVDRVHVVVRSDDRVDDRTVGDPGGAREAERGDAAARGDQELVGVTVVATGELHDLRPARGTAGEAHRRHRRLGSRRHEPELLHRRHAIDDGLRQLDLGRSGRTVRRTRRGGALHRFDHLGVRMPEDRGSPRLHVVEVLATLGVDESCTLGAGHEERLAPDTAERPNR